MTGFSHLYVAPHFPVGVIVPPPPTGVCLAVSVSEVRAWLHAASGVAFDAVVQEAILVAQDYIVRNVLYQPICRTDVGWFFSGTGAVAMPIPYREIVSVVSVAKYNDQTGNYDAQTLGDYKLLETEAGWWLLALALGVPTSWGTEKFKVVLRAGWATPLDATTVPPLMRQAVRWAACWLLKQSSVTDGAGDPVGYDRVGLDSHSEEVPDTGLIGWADLAPLDAELRILCAPFCSRRIY